MEIWDIYNKNRIKTGKTVLRCETLAKGEYHVVVHVCIFSSDGRLLIQQRQNFKGKWPNMWDFSTAGSAISGETSNEAAIREVREELGVDLSSHLSELMPTFTVNFDDGFDDFYILKQDLSLDKLILQKEEVQAVAYADKAKVLSMIDNGSFIPYHNSLVSLIFDFNEFSCAYSG